MRGDDDLDLLLDQLPQSQRDKWLKGEPIGPKPVAVKVTKQDERRKPFPITRALWKVVILTIVYSVWLVGVLIQFVGNILVKATENAVHYKLR